MFSTLVSFDNMSVGGQIFEWHFPGAFPDYSVEENPDIKFPDGVVNNYEVDLITYTDFGCADTSRQIVEVLSEVILYVPNTFTPNGDAFNNTWRMSIAGVEAESFQLTVYNRWGAAIFQTNNIDHGWDGTHNGDDIPSGIYSYTVKAKDAISSEQYEWSGNVTIIR